MTEKTLRRHETRHKTTGLESLLTDGLNSAKANEAASNKQLLDIFHLKDFSELARALAPQTVTITIAGGSATRMLKSLEADHGTDSIVKSFGVMRDQPRACVKVDNVSSAYLPIAQGQPHIPVGVYSLMALRTPDNKPLGRHILIHAPQERGLLNRQIVEPLDISYEGISYFEQRRFLDPESNIMKPLGHGDALLQLINDANLRPLLDSRPIWIINFAGDANSPIRVIQAASTLFALRILQEKPISEIIPVAQINDPKYPIYLGEHNIPTGTVQNRNGVLSTNGQRSNWMNCGVRVMYGPDVIPKLQAMFDFHSNADYKPINQAGKNDFPIDLLDAQFMIEGRTRLMALSLHGETCAVKSVSDIPNFGEKAKEVLSESTRLYRHNYSETDQARVPDGRLLRVGNTRNKFVFHREGILRSLPNLQFVEALSLEEARKTQTFEYLTALFGQSLMTQMSQEIAGRNAITASEHYGYGHTFQSHANLMHLSDIGINGYGVLASDLSTRRERQATRMKQETLKLLHHKKGMRDIITMIDAKSPLELIEDLRTVCLLLMSESYMRSAGIDFLNHKNALLDPFTALFVKLMEKNQDLASFLFHQFALSDTKFIDLPLREGLLSLVNGLDPISVFHTHSASARAMLDTPYEKGVYYYPDPGFASLPLAFPLVVPSKKMLYVIPRSEPVLLTLQRYGIPEEHIYSVGTLTRSLNIEEAQNKWDSQLQKKRRILIPLSGNGNGIPYMKKALEDYSHYKNSSERHDSYELVLFFGHHNNGETREIKEMIHKLNLTDDPNIVVIEAKNMAEAAEFKWREKIEAHVEICKGGESALDTQATATIHLALPGAGPNEDTNVMFALNRYGSSLPSPWPQNVRNYWQNNPLLKNKFSLLPHYKLFDIHSPNNLFEQLDIFWEQAREIALNSYQLADSNAATVGLALALGHLSKDLRFDPHGALHDSASKRIKAWAVEIDQEEKRRKKS